MTKPSRLTLWIAAGLSASFFLTHPSHEEGPTEDPTATYIWLGHVREGYAIRQGGPVGAPGD